MKDGVKYARCDIVSTHTNPSANIRGSIYFWQKEGGTSLQNMLSVKVKLSGVHVGWHGMHIMEATSMSDGTCQSLTRKGIFDRQDLNWNQRRQLQGMLMPPGRMGMIYSDWRGLVDQGVKYQNLSLFTTDILNQGLIIYEGQDTIVRTSSKPNYTDGNEKMPQSYARVVNHSQIIGCCFIKPVNPFDTLAI